MGLVGWLGIIRVVLVAIGKKQNECLFFYLLSSPFPIPFSFFEREMKTDIIQYWLEMVYVEMNIIFPLFVSLGLFSLREGVAWVARI